MEKFNKDEYVIIPGVERITGWETLDDVPCKRVVKEKSKTYFCFVRNQFGEPIPYSIVLDEKITIDDLEKIKNMLEQRRANNEPIGLPEIAFLKSYDIIVKDFMGE